MRVIALVLSIALVASATYVGKKHLQVTEDGTLLIQGENGNEIRITKPTTLLNGRRFEILVTGPHVPTKKIQIEDHVYSTYPKTFETTSNKDVLSQVDILTKIFQQYQGLVDDVSYEKLLALVEKAVIKGEISPKVLVYLRNINEAFRGEVLIGDMSQNVQQHNYPTTRYGFQNQHQDYPESFYHRYGREYPSIWTQFQTRQGEYTPYHSRQGEYTPYYAKQAEFTPYYARQGEYTPYHSRQVEFTPYHTKQGEFTPYHTKQGEFTPYHTKQGEFTPYYAKHHEFMPFYARQGEFTPYHTKQEVYTPYETRYESETTPYTRRHESHVAPYVQHGVQHQEYEHVYPTFQTTKPYGFPVVQKRMDKMEHNINKMPMTLNHEHMMMKTVPEMTHENMHHENIHHDNLHHETMMMHHEEPMMDKRNNNMMFKTNMMH